MLTELDEIDRQLLAALQRNARLTTGELAQMTGLSQSPCWRRIQRLREEGYIKGVVAIVDPKLMGFNMQIFAQVKMTTLSDDERANFTRRSTPSPRSSTAGRCSGRWTPCCACWRPT